jgi:NTP pyrophosphatase (non-canonical NTP hydrolase)|tara:strand:+ start:128 stop:466 length:339 start_codon:yes stop_codon:yes gene_type:complete
MGKEINDLQKAVIQFRENRDWKQFHKIKDLILGLNIEVSELQELFLWKNEKEEKEIEQERIEDEIADVFIFLTYICDEYEIDLEKVVREKIQKNELKYPVEKSKGSNKKYTE